jgi:hypothetical protein
LSTSTFDSTKDHLDNLLRSAREGAAQLPDFQRGWVWDDEHVRDLLASVSQSFPIGTVMMLESGTEVTFKTRPLEGVEADNVEPDELVLDGQQRLTSLYQALFSGRPVETKDAKKKPISRWYYIDIRKALDPEADREDAILSIPESRIRMRNFGREVDLDLSTTEREHAAMCFPLSQVFDHYEWARGFREFHDHSADVTRLWDDFERAIVQQFLSYQLPVIRLNKHTPKEAVCLVFEKVNTGGVNLTVFELLTATFAAVAPPGFELRADWEARRKRLHELKVLRELSSTDFIQAITLLATWKKRIDAAEHGENDDRLPAISCKRRDMLRLTFDEYQQWADRAEAGFKAAARFLHREHVFETRFLPYGTQVIPLAAILTALGSNAEGEGVRSKIARWYWCGVFGELYGSTTETRFARDLQDVLIWVQHGGEPRTIDEANFAPERLLTLRTRGSAAYKGLYVLLLREGARDFRTGETATDQTYFDERIDIHHVFPQKWCRDRKPNAVEPAVFNSIINKTPLTARTNRRVGGAAPSSYLEKLQADDGIPAHVIDDHVRSHLIDPTMLRSNDFNAFLNQRRLALLKKIEAVMGKTLIADPDEGFESDEEQEDEP